MTMRSKPRFSNFAESALISSSKGILVVFACAPGFLDPIGNPSRKAKQAKTHRIGDLSLLLRFTMGASPPRYCKTIAE